MHRSIAVVAATMALVLTAAVPTVTSAGLLPIAVNDAYTVVHGKTRTVAAPGVLAQERFVVTGSSIARTQTEGALPVLTLDRQYIEQSGVTTATELIQQLPQVQNFVAASTGVNGGGVGNTISLTDIAAVEATVGLHDEERSILRAVTPPVLIYLTAAGILGMVVLYFF